MSSGSVLNTHGIGMVNPSSGANTSNIRHRSEHVNNAEFHTGPSMISRGGNILINDLY